VTRAGHWLLGAGLAGLLFPWYIVGLPVELVAVGVALMLGGSFLLEHNWSDVDEPGEDEPRALTDDDVRVPYVPPDRLWSRP